MHEGWRLNKALLPEVRKILSLLGWGAVASQVVSGDWAGQPCAPLVHEHDSEHSQGGAHPLRRVCRPWRFTAWTPCSRVGMGLGNTGSCSGWGMLGLQVEPCTSFGVSAAHQQCVHGVPNKGSRPGGRQREQHAAGAP